MIRSMKRWFITLFSVVGLLAASIVGYLTFSVANASAEPAKVMKISIDTANATWISDVGELADDSYIGLVVAPFPKKELSTDGPFKNNYFSNWWTGAGSNFTISYEFYSPTPLNGMAGVVPVFSTNPWYYCNGSEVTSTEGMDMVSIDNVEALSNGWYSRTIVIDPAVISPTVVDGQVLVDTYLTMVLKKSDLPTSGTIDMYYKNFTVKIQNRDYIMYDGTTNAFAHDGELVSTCIDHYEALKNATGEPSIKVHLGAAVTVTGADTPDPVSINVLKDDIIIETNAETDLLQFVSTSKTDVSASVLKVVNGEGADVTSQVAGGKFTPTEAGTYKVTYAATDSLHTAKVTIEMIAESSAKPIILQKDVDDVLTAVGTATQPYTLNPVYATVNGVKNFPTVPSVKAPDGTVVKVRSLGDGKYEFTPLAKVEGTYTVTFTATNEKLVTEASGTVQVIDADKPVISFDNLPTSLTPGNFFEIPLISVTDISDGTFEREDYTLTVIDPEGKTVETENDRFLVELSGNYTFRVVAVDSDNNEISKETTLVASQSQGMILKLTVNVPEESRAEGVRKFYTAQIYQNIPDVVLNAGDTLIYEVMSSTPIAGVGSFNGQVNGDFQGMSWPQLHQLYTLKADSPVLDTVGDSMAATTDISDKLTENGKSIWYRREVPIVAGGVLAGASVYHWGVVIDTKAACGETIEVYYKNAYIKRADGSIQNVFDGTQTIQGTEWQKEGVTSGSLSATLDKFPVVVQGLIPTSGDLKQKLEIPKYLMVDQFTNTPILTTVTITDPNGSAVAVNETDTGYEFVPEISGIYKILLQGSNETGMTEATLEFEARDLLAPTITYPEFSREGKVGTAFEIPAFEFSDNVTAKEDLITEIKVFFGGVEVSIVGGKFQMDKAGDYMIVVSVKDESGLEKVDSIIITATEEDAGDPSDPSGDPSDPSGSGDKEQPAGTANGGCSGMIGVSALAGAAVILMACTVLILKRKVEKK